MTFLRSQRLGRSRQRVGVAVVALSITVAGVALGPAASATTHTTTDIGTKQWWDANVPYTAPKMKTINGRKGLHCPKGSGVEIAGARRELTDDGVRVTFSSNASRKYVRLPWINGKTKRVRSGQAVCRYFVERLKPASVAELSTWTFAKDADLYGNVLIERPPLGTCTPAELPSFISPELVGAQYVNSGGKLVYQNSSGTTYTTTVDRDGTLTGFLTIGWTLDGGQGEYRYPTWESNSDGVMAEVWRTVRLNPEATTVIEGTYPVTTDLVTTLGGEVFSSALQLNGSSTGRVVPLCGEEYLPSWSKGFVSDGQGDGGVSVDGILTAGGTRADVVLNLINSKVPTSVN